MGPAIATGDYVKFNALFVPSVAAPDTSSTVQAAVLDFIRWDLAFVTLSTFMACVWVAKTITQVAVIIVWLMVASVVFGLGSAVVGVFAWRERVLNTVEDEDGTRKMGGSKLGS
jgi:hypothetical protein